MTKNRFIAVAFLIFAFGIAILYFAYAEIDAIAAGYVMKYLQSTGENRAEQVRLFLEGKQNRVIDFSSDGFIKNSLYDIKNGKNTKETMEKLSYHLTVNKMPVDGQFYKVLALGINGVVVASTDKDSIGLDLAGDPVFLEGRNRPYVKNLSYDNISNVKSFALSAPVARENEFVGVIVIKMLPDVLINIVAKENNFGKTIETYIINKDGYLITPSRFFKGENKGILTQIVDSGNAKECSRDLAKRKREQKNGPVAFIDYRGEKVIGGHYIIPEMNWCLLTEMDKIEVKGDVGVKFAIALSLMFAGVGLIALSIFLIARRKHFEWKK